MCIILSSQILHIHFSYGEDVETFLQVHVLSSDQMCTNGNTSNEWDNLNFNPISPGLSCQMTQVFTCQVSYPELRLPRSCRLVLLPNRLGKIQSENMNPKPPQAV